MSMPRAPVAMRRSEAQLRVAAQRIAIGEAWADFERAAAEGEAKVRRVTTWMRRVSALTALLAGGVALRQLLHGGFASRAIGVLTLARGARRLFEPGAHRFWNHNVRSPINDSQ
jgi:hypothetical protein